LQRYRNNSYEKGEYKDSFWVKHFSDMKDRDPAQIFRVQPPCGTEEMKKLNVLGGM
jgi:hypothetical protein